MNDEKIDAVKRLATTVYLCQVLTFGFFGLPLLVGLGINFFKRKEAEGTWLESHFNWQVKTAWVVIAGFAIGGFTFQMGIAGYVLLPFIVWMVYRITVGWYALNDNRPIS